MGLGLGLGLQILPGMGHLATQDHLDDVVALVGQVAG
jgi:hypothetical protein